MLNILIYHKLYKDKENEKINSHSINIEKFKYHLETLQHKKVVIAEGFDIANTKGKHYSITFDDGALSDYTLALPLLKKYQLLASFYIISERVGTKGYMSKKQIQELHSAGMKIGSHSCSHAKLSLIDEETLYRELLESKKYLEQLIGGSVDSLSVPGGFYNKNVIKMAKTLGYKYILVSDPGINYAQEIVLKRNTLKENSNFDRAINSSFYLFLYAFRNTLLKTIKKRMGNERYENLKKRVFR